MNALDKVFRIIPKCLMKDFVCDKLICDKYFPTEEDNAENGYNEQFWDDIFEKDLVWCEDFYNWSGREYSAKDICVMIQFLHHGDYLDTFILGDIDPEYLVGHTINNILRYEINGEFQEWCKEKLGTDPDPLPEDSEEEEEEEEEGGVVEESYVDYYVVIRHNRIPYYRIPFIRNENLVSLNSKVYQIIDGKIQVNQDNEPSSIGIIVERANGEKTIVFMSAFKHMTKEVEFI